MIDIGSVNKDKYSTCQIILKLNMFIFIIFLNFSCENQIIFEVVAKLNWSG